MKISPVSRIGKTSKLLLILIVLILGLSGCGKEPQQGLPGGPAPAVIEVWHSLLGAEAVTLESQSQRIMGAHPEVLIRLKYVPEDKMVSLTYQAQAGGEGPEIFITSAETLRQMYQQGALAPVLGKSDPFPGLVAPFHHNEQDYVQPMLTDLPLFYYRTDLAQPPASLADFLETKGVLVLPSLDTNNLSSWWSGQGGKLLSKGQPTINDPANLVFLQQLKAWQEAKRIALDSNAWSQFVNGEAAFTISWASQAKSLDSSIPWGAILPTDLVGGQGQILPGRTLGIANSSIKQSEAINPLVQLVEEELLTPDSQWALGQAGNRFPASIAFYTRPEAQQGVLQHVNRGLAKVWPLAENAPERKLIPLQDKAWQTTWNGVAPEDALAAAQAEAVQVLSQK